MVGAVGALTLASCASSPEVTPNVPAQVVSHEYDDRDVWTSFVMVGRVMVPITHVDPEHFYLTVQQCGHDEFKDENSDGCGQFQVEVNSDTYQVYNDGSNITFSEDN